jgi:HD superfamily phosphodiesterase
MSLLAKLFKFVMMIVSKYSIDESHGVSHSMNVLNYASEIYNSEVTKFPILKSQEKIIYVSSILHDMCDKKYMDQNSGIKTIEEFINDKMTPSEISVTKLIISTMSYSYVKKYGFPELGPYQKAYHIVREADLLSAYDFDRCIIYKMYKNETDFVNSFNDAEHLFKTRVLKHNEDNLFLTDYSKKLSVQLERTAINRMASWKKIIKSPTLF